MSKCYDKRGGVGRVDPNDEVVREFKRQCISSLRWSGLAQCVGARWDLWFWDGDRLGDYRGMTVYPGDASRGREG